MKTLNKPLLALVPCLSLFAVNPVNAASVNIAGGGSSNWSINDTGITTNGLPAGGSCTSTTAGSGATINDANIPAGGDAFDMGGMVWIDSTQLVGALSQAGNRVTFSSSNISGINAQLIYDVLTTSATLRVLTTLNNPTASPITISLDYATNFGSDSGTQVRGSSSGDTTFTSADSWVVTSDASDSDPVNNTVIFGAGSAPVTPNSVTQTVFSCAGTQGVGANYSVTVPAGETVSMMFFQRMSDTTANALIEAAEFDAPELSPNLLEGLSQAELAQIQNFDLGAAPPVAPTSIPTMSVWGLGILAGLLGLIGMRRRS